MASGWTLQKQNRAKGLYFQAVAGKGSERRCVTLGYLSAMDAEKALTRLRTLDEGKARKVVHEPDPRSGTVDEHGHLTIPGEPDLLPAGGFAELSLADKSPLPSWATRPLPCTGPA